MNYDEAKLDALAMLPEMGDLYVREVDQQLLLIRYALAGVVIATYGPEPSGPADENVHLQRWTVDKWIAAVTARALRRATPDDIPERQRIVFEAGPECGRALP